MRPKLYPERLEIRVTDDQKEKLQKLARRRQITLNQAIRDLIDNSK